MLRKRLVAKRLEESDEPLGAAHFIERLRCIACQSSRLSDICSGRFDEGPVGEFLSGDPWGEDPMPFLVGQAWRYVRCNDCGQAFHRYILDAEWNERRFSRWMTQGAIDEFERQRATPRGDFAMGSQRVSHILRIEKLTRPIRGERRARVLDFGCGYGQFLALCAQFGFEAHGVDRSQARRARNGRSIYADLSDLGDMRFDAITLFEVLEHLDHPRDMLKGLVDRLLPGGVLILEVPDCKDVVGITTRSDYDKIHPLEHINGFTAESLQALAERVGMRRIVPPAAYVTTRSNNVLRQWAKEKVAAGMRRTQQYFLKDRGSAK